jgi:hypothetical protein
LATARVSKIESLTMVPLAPSTLAKAVDTVSGSGLLFATSSEVVQASARVEERLDVLDLARAARTRRNRRLLDLDQLTGALEGLDLPDQLVELLHPRLAQALSVVNLPAQTSSTNMSPPVPIPRPRAPTCAPHRSGNL